MIRSTYAMLMGIILAGWGCTTPNVTAEIEGEPLCEDFEIGATRTKMKGGLKKPVRVSVLEDEDDDFEDAISSRTLLGKRTPESGTPKVLVVDSDETYFVEWAQCENERAPLPVRKQERGAAEVAAFQCGEAKVYAKTKLEVRKGDAASRVIHWQAPPDAACWADQVPTKAEPEPSATPTAEATAEPAASAEPDASAQPSASAKAPPAPATAAPPNPPATATPATKD